MERRLAAIVAADVVGYSRLMEQDEVGTLAALKTRRKEVLEPLVTKHQGRIFKVAGDGVLVEFVSAVNAVQCAVELQHGMAAANGDLPEDRRIMLRVGVNLGDVMVEGSDLYGDGVNIAARLEGIAEPGGILVSGTTYDYVKNKISAGFDELGTQTLKNIAEPVRAYRVVGTPAVMLAVPKVTTEKPSIAVLPFDNLSGDLERQFFSDGITEDIIAALSRFRSIFVIARNSSFQYRDKATDVRRIARELGVQYVVEGSVRKAGNQLRITAQLIDATTGNHVWAERYDGSLDDVFAVQDEVVHTIVASLEGRLATRIAEQSRRKPTQNLAAYECVLQAREHLSTFDTAAAEPLLRRAIELDPGYAQAHSWLAGVFLVNYFFDPQSDLLDHALVYGKRAVSLDPSDGLCHSGLGLIYMFRRQFELAGLHCERALALNPNDAGIIVDHGNWLTRIGRVTEALIEFDKALKRDPFPPSYYWETRSVALCQARRFEEAIEAVRRMSRLFSWSHAMLAACHAQLGRRDEARAEAAEVLRMQPDFTVSWLMREEPFENPADAEPLLEGLRMAGLPE
jgi:TolB-like protein